RTQPYLRDNAFLLNPKTHLYEIDREAYRNDLTRGIAFNDAGHTFLTNQDLKATLLKIKKELLGGRKIDLLGMDACHMAMVEICSQVKESASLLVGSQEIEPGAGWNYSEVLEPFKTKSPEAKELALQAVRAYGEKYNHAFADLTQSAIDLTNQTALEENISEVSTRLIQLIRKDRTHLPLLINIRKSPQTTLAFLDSDYVDLSLFYKSLKEKLVTHRGNNRAAPLQKALREKISEGLAILDQTIIQSTAGSRVRKAGGLSIYFPQHSITSSYLQTVFAQNTSWCSLLGQCLSHNVRSMQEQTQVAR
ncbi:hypothetical protein KAT92_05560, partial [Candidatus Babeliales bacterium]|nr:hypothetical protein [Candidatus Babeliales bacterium]